MEVNKFEIFSLKKLFYKKQGENEKKNISSPFSKYSFTIKKLLIILYNIFFYTKQTFFITFFS